MQDIKLVTGDVPNGSTSSFLWSECGSSRCVRVGTCIVAIKLDDCSRISIADDSKIELESFVDHLCPSPLHPSPAPNLASRRNKHLISFERAPLLGTLLQPAQLLVPIAAVRPIVPTGPIAARIASLTLSDSFHDASTGL